MDTNRLTFEQRIALAAGALATLLAVVMAQCPLLAVDVATRGVLALTAAGLALLCVSILLEDIVVRPLVKRFLRAAQLTPPLLNQ